VFEPQHRLVTIPNFGEFLISGTKITPENGAANRTRFFVHAHAKTEEMQGPWTALLSYFVLFRGF
jgi:hypothetical protein